MASDSVCSAAFVLISEPHLLQLLFQFFKSTSANEPDRTGGKVEFAGDFLIGSRRILEEHGGAIAARARLPKGTIFEVTLPALVAAERATAGYM